VLRAYGGALTIEDVALGRRLLIHETLAPLR
jgi:hypothetical protein